jgi:hypothetical protein
MAKKSFSKTKPAAKSHVSGNEAKMKGGEAATPQSNGAMKNEETSATSREQRTGSKLK